LKGGLFETEAELGSDNEENEVRKEINKDDAEEKEEGLDRELEELIDNQHVQEYLEFNF
jgi:hypothetical protein